MFYGEYRHAIDKKGRVIIPAKFRNVFKKINKNNLVITRGLEKSLFIFSIEEWENQKEKLRALSLNKSVPRAFSRLLFSGSYKCPIDRQGRINLPQSLIQYADIKKEVVIIGVSDRIEIWDSDRWEEYINKSKFFYGKVARELAGEKNLKGIANGRVSQVS